MRMLFLAPLSLLSLGAMAAPGNSPPAAETARQCPPPVATAALPKPDKPGVRKLGEEPPARHIAAVYGERDGCPVMLVLDGPTPGWTPAPESGLHKAD